MTKPLRHLLDKVLMGAARLVSKLPDNDYLHCYTITNGTTNYLTRLKLPRIFGMRVMLHKIWRADSDGEMHNHPWDKAYSFILLGSYVEERLDLDGELVARIFKSIGETPAAVKRRVKDVKWFNRLYKEDFHKIIEIDGPLWTIFIAGKRIADKNGVEWGFLKEETRQLIPHEEYINSTGSHRS